MGHPARRIHPLWLLIGCLSSAGCFHTEVAGWYAPHVANPAHCREVDQSIDLNDRIGALNALAHAFEDRCYDTVIKYGTLAQTEFRFKTYSLTKEFGSLFVPDGTLTDYTLESYERGYLTFLLSASYYQMHKQADAMVELRRLDNELYALLYNFGQDPVNIALSAVMWEKLGEEGEARVDWNQLRQRKDPSQEAADPVRTFALNRIAAIDAGDNVRSDWRVFAVGQFPEVDWDLKFTDSTDGYFRVSANGIFLPDCSSGTGLRISTRSWFHKIAVRHSNEYHPLLNFQSWIRLPVGLIYSIVPLTTGAGVAVGGCVLDAYGHGNGSFCEVSIKGGVAIMNESPKVLKGTVQPDLRHWENVPSDFLMTTAEDLNQEPCFTSIPVGLRRSETFVILQ